MLFVTDTFQRALLRGEKVRIEDWLNASDAEQRDQTLLELLKIELGVRGQRGERPVEDEYLRRFPAFSDQVQAAFTEIQKTSPQHGAQLTATQSRLSGHERTVIPDGSVQAKAPPTAPIRQAFGRYRVESRLGQGSFGEVYRAWDDQLQRAVAIKVTFHENLDSRTRESFLTEARAVAGLDHPNIVPVYDVGQTDEGDYYVVSKLIEGEDLAKRMKKQRLSPAEIVEIVAGIAAALHHAHTRGLVHRDVKPGNILLDPRGQAFLADFGLALSENQLGRGSGLAGTPKYMSPEQARHNGHRVDGRSDIYSLGVVLYELLTGRTPFQASDCLELLELIAETDVRPPRQIDDTLSPAMERVCLRALSRSLAERYSTAKDFADALRAANAPLNTELPASSAGLVPHRPAGKRKGESPEVHSKRNRWAIASIFAGLMLAVAFAGSPWSRSTVVPSEEPSLSSITPAPLDIAQPSAPLSLSSLPDLKVERFDIMVSRDRGPFLPIDQLVPLRGGDHVRFSIEFNRPAHAGLVWIDAEGSAAELYPLDPEIGNRGASPIQSLNSPLQLDRGWPLQGAGGVETAVLLISDDPLPPWPDESWRLSPRQPRWEVPLARYHASRLLETARTIAGDAPRPRVKRSLGHQAGQVDDPVLNLLEELRQQFDLVHAVSILHDSSTDFQQGTP